MIKMKPTEFRKTAKALNRNIFLKVKVFMNIMWVKMMKVIINCLLKKSKNIQYFYQIMITQARVCIKIIKKK